MRSPMSTMRSPTDRVDRLSTTSNLSVMCGTPRTPNRWPSVNSLRSITSEKEPSLLQSLAARFPASSYNVSDEPAKLPSRHIAFAPSPTHSVHQSEHSVLPYGEIYGEHPMSFEFDAVGNKVPREDRRKEEMSDPRQCIEGVR